MQKPILVKSVILLLAAPVCAAFLAVAGAGAQESPPPAGPPRDFTLPEVERFTLENGLSAALVQQGDVPKVTISAVVGVGDVDEKSRDGRAAVLAEMMKEGAAGRSSEEIAYAAASMGGELSVNADREITTVSVDVIAQFVPQAVALIADVVREPTLPEAELARIKQNQQRSLAVALSQPRNQADAAFHGLLYGGTPYGALFPEADALAAVTRDRIAAFHAAHFSPSAVRVYVAGQFDTAAARKAIEEAFADWTGAAPPSQPAAAGESGLRVRLIDRPGAPQSTIYLGLPVIGPAHEDYVPLDVTNTLLGGSFISRITANIREDKGYTYSPRSRLITHTGSAHWVQIADVTTEATGPALAEIYKEIDGLRQAAPTGDELKKYQNYQAGLFVIRNSDRGGLINILEFVDRHGLGADFLADYVDTVHAVAPGRTRALAERYLDPGEMTLVVVGDLNVVADQLRGLAPLEGVTFDIVGPGGDVAP